MRLTLFLVSYIASIGCFSQSMLTYREVYNFSVGDVFQYHVETSGLPQGFMKTILGKSIKNSDTVLYSIQNVSYSSSWDNGKLVLHFSKVDNIITYSNLDSLVCSDFRRKNNVAGPDNKFNDTVIFSKFWNTRVYEYDRVWGPFLDKWYETKVFGEGLGQMEDYIANPSNSYKIHYSLSYCKRNGVESGTPENAYLLNISLPPDQQTIKVRPNPVNNQFSLSAPIKEPSKIRIVNYLGETLIELDLRPNESIINVENLKPGIYFLYLSKNGNISSSRFIKS